MKYLAILCVLFICGASYAQKAKPAFRAGMTEVELQKNLKLAGARIDSLRHYRVAIERVMGNLQYSVNALGIVDYLNWENSRPLTPRDQERIVSYVTARAVPGSAQDREHSVWFATSDTSSMELFTYPHKKATVTIEEMTLSYLKQVVDELNAALPRARHISDSLEAENKKRK